MKTPRFKVDLIGNSYGRLIVTGWTYVELKSGRQFRWRCSCSCGIEITVQTYDLTSGHTKSCGCLNSELVSDRNRTHGMSAFCEYSSWIAAKTRVSNPNTNCVENYLDRGITMSEEWFNSFEQFFADMGKKPSKEYTLERKDVNLGYCKENCIWENRSIQAFNQRLRSTNTSGRTGVSWNKGHNKWEAKIKNKRLILTVDFDLACFCREEAELSYYGKTKQ